MSSIGPAMGEVTHSREQMKWEEKKLKTILLNPLGSKFKALIFNSIKYLIFNIYSAEVLKVHQL